MPPDVPALVARDIATFIVGQRQRLDELGPALVPFVDAADRATAGGKRLRASFCHAGWFAAGGEADDQQAVWAAAALELLQASALVHDDVMDDSDVRRGQPAAHRAFEQQHRTAGWLGDPTRFGVGAAVLLGDLLLGWTDEMFWSCGLASEVILRALPYLDACKTEVAAGQYLDLLAQASGTIAVEDAMRVVRFKSAKYTVERPLHVGAALAGADAPLIEALTAFGLPLGEAFQLRDDVLGVFGDPAVTGKPAGDDLREGKRTVLLAHAHARGDTDDRALLRALVGDPGLDGAAVAALRGVITGTGALAQVESDIARLERTAQAALAAAPLASEAARSRLAQLAEQSLHRSA